MHAYDHAALCQFGLQLFSLLYVFFVLFSLCVLGVALSSSHFLQITLTLLNKTFLTLSPHFAAGFNPALPSRPLSHIL